MLVAIGLERQSAPVAAREKLAAASQDLGDVLRSYGALSGVDEVFVVSTCYRVEVYAATTCPAAAAASLSHALRERAGDDTLPLFDLRGEEAFRHLCRVASSLESGVIGEPQVLGQVRESFGAAATHGTASRELSALMARVLQVAKRVRTETAIGRAGVSWGHAAANVAEKVLGPLDGRQVLVVGAGEMARVSAKHLREEGAEITVVNRTRATAEALAAEVGGRAAGLEALGDELAGADVAIVAAPVQHPALTPAGARALMRQRRHRRLLLVDLAVPRVVPPELGDLDGFYVCDVDDLALVQRQAQVARAEAVTAADGIIEEEVGRYARALAERRAAPLIAAVRHQAAAIAREEVERTVRRLGGDAELERRLDALAGAIVAKVLHQPSVRLRQAGTDGESGTDLMQAAARIFDVGEPPSARPA